jgi:methyl-accepting chemotaxis protein
MTEAGKASIEDYSTAYSDTLSDMTINTSNFDEYFNKACDSMEEALEDYEDTVETIADESGTKYGELEEALEKVSNATDGVKNSGNEAVSAMQANLSVIQEQAGAYATLAANAREAAREMSSVATAIGSDVESYSGVSVGNEINYGTENYA